MKDTQVKAIVYPKYGSADVLQFKDVDRPIPNEDEVLVKVGEHAVSGSDQSLRHAPVVAR